MAQNLLDAIARSMDIGWLTTCLNHNIKTGNISAVEAVWRRLTELAQVEQGDRGDLQRRMSAVDQALAIWPVLVDRAVNAGSPVKVKITYGDLVVAIGYPNKKAALSIKRALGLIGWYCLQNNLPTLNSLVVNQDTTMAWRSGANCDRAPDHIC